MDAVDQTGFKLQFASQWGGIPDAQLGWYASQGFIGYQLCAIIAQHWLVDKACTMPARDAVRVGYEITVTDGSEVPPEKLDALRKMDQRMNLDYHLEQFVRMGRVFGIRIALFNVESPDKDYYEKPFNPDGVKKNSYKGISQIDPFWMTPQFEANAIQNPAAMDFYEPTWWVIGGRKIHKTHLVIMRTSEVPDTLKPSYMYGGVSVPQRIYERVYAAERTANEAPMLAMTKRTTALHMDIAQAMAMQDKFEEKIAFWTHYRDNYGIKVLGTEETIEQFDTALGDLDETIMTQYQLVSAAAGVPASKLLGTTPKGFNSTGEYEEASYREELESIQTHDLTPMIMRHHLLCIRSEISPGAVFETGVEWNPLDSPTAEEIATVNKTKADTDVALINAGVIDGYDARARLINDESSGYNGIELEAEIERPDDIEEEPDDNSDAG